MEDALYKDIMAIGEDIVSSDRFAKARAVPHHSKGGNIALHSLETLPWMSVMWYGLACYMTSA